jgi:hypothetical protein
MEVTLNTTRSTDQRIAALVSGIGLLFMAVIAAVANFALIQGAIVPGDAGATAANIAASEGMFRLGAIGLVIVAILDVVVAWGLYEVFRPVDNGLSLLAGWLRLAYAAIFAAAIVNLFTAARTASGDALETLRLTQLFDDGYNVGLIVFGLHLVVVGFLAVRAEFIHWVFGALLIVAGLGYLVDSIVVLAIPEYSLDIGLYTFVGELVFIFWLLVRWRKLAPQG